MNKEITLKKVILQTFKKYEYLFNSDDLEDKKHLIACIGSKIIKEDNFEFIDLKIEVLYKILFEEKKDWFQRIYKLIRDDIEFAFYTKQYSIDKINYFFENIFNDSIFIKVTSSKNAPEYDDLHDLYLKILKELNYTM